MRRRSQQRISGRREPVRPTTSRVLSAVFSMLGPDGARGRAFLDLYAGTGGFGLEAIRRGASRVVMVESNRHRAAALEAAVVNAETGTVITRDALKSLATIDGPFDVVFADPPYADRPFEALAEKLMESGLVADGGVVMLEHFHKTDLPDRLHGLQVVTRRRYGDSAITVYKPADKSEAGEAGEEP